LKEEIRSIIVIITVNIDTLVNMFTNSVIRIANLTIGKSTSKNKKPKVPWWNHNIKSAIEDKYKALKQFQQSKTQEDFIELNLGQEPDTRLKPVKRHHGKISQTV